MSYTPFIDHHQNSSYTLDGSHRSSNRATLFDGKIMFAENANRWATTGTGTFTYNNNSVEMSVTAGQYAIRQSKLFMPYFSGKPQQIEATAFNFHSQSGIVKRLGYFSSSIVAPYDTQLDGIWIESDATGYHIKCSNNGTLTHSIPWTQWDGYEHVASYDWSKFTVFEIDFLWLGGAGVRVFMVIDGQFKLIHTIANHTGFASSLIINYPNQPVRYEIRSTTGNGTFTSICSQVSSEGGKDEQGEEVVISNVSKPTDTIGTNYLICAARKPAAFRNHYITLDYFSTAITGGTADSGLMMICLNPTFSATPTWVSESKLEYTIPATAITVTNLGRVLRAIPILGNGAVQPGALALLKNLTNEIDGTPVTLALVYRPLTATQTISGTMMLLEY